MPKHIDIAGEYGVVDGSIHLFNPDGSEKVMWDSAEWVEDPSLVYVIVNAVVQESPDTKIVEALRTLPWGLDEDISGSDLVDTVYELLATNGRLPDDSPEPKPQEVPRIPCQECGVGYYIGEEGCRHTPYTGPPPGSHCQFVKTGNEITHVRHHEPCPDGHTSGTVTEVKTGKVVDL